MNIFIWIKWMIMMNYNEIVLNYRHWVVSYHRNRHRCPTGVRCGAFFDEERALGCVPLGGHPAPARSNPLSWRCWMLFFFFGCCCWSSAGASWPGLDEVRWPHHHRRYHPIPLPWTHLRRMNSDWDDLSFLQLERQSEIMKVTSILIDNDD